MPDTLTLESNATLHVVPDKEKFEEKDGNGVQELVVKFDRGMFQQVLPQGEFFEVMITVRGALVCPIDTTYTFVWNNPALASIVQSGIMSLCGRFSD